MSDLCHLLDPLYGGKKVSSYSITENLHLANFCLFLVSVIANLQVHNFAFELETVKRFSSCLAFLTHLCLSCGSVALTPSLFMSV